MTSYLIVTDGGSDAGLGHVVESVAIASRLGPDVDLEFVVPGDGPAAEMLTSRESAPVSVVSWSELPGAIAARDPAVLVTNLPSIDAEGLTRFGEALDGGRLVCFGRPGATLPEAVGTLADVVVDFSKDVGAWTSRRDERDGTVFLEGPQYFVPRPSFEGYRQTWQGENTIREVLLLFGGSDPSNYTLRYAEKLLDHTVWRLDVVVGPGYQFEKGLEETVDRYPSERFRLTRDADDVESRLAAADVLLTSPGQTMYESLYVGCPLVAICQTGDQTRIYGDLPFVYEDADVDDAPGVVERTWAAFRSGEFSYRDIGGGVAEIVTEITGRSPSS